VRRWNISARQRHTAANGRDYSSDRSPPVGRAKTIAILELIYANEDATWDHHPHRPRRRTRLAGWDVGWADGARSKWPLSKRKWQ